MLKVTAHFPCLLFNDLKISAILSYDFRRKKLNLNYSANYLPPVINFFPNCGKWSLIHTLCRLSELCCCFPGRGDRRARGGDSPDVGRESAGGAEPHRGVHDLQPAHCPGNASCSCNEPVPAWSHLGKSRLVLCTAALTKTIVNV